MLVVGMVVLFAGYTVGSYGLVLIKGWNITFRQWISPLHPYNWPADGSDPPTIPPSQLFPSSKDAAAGQSGAGGGPPLTPAERAKRAQQGGRDISGRLGP